MDIPRYTTAKAFTFDVAASKGSPLSDSYHDYIGPYNQDNGSNSAGTNSLVGSSVLSGTNDVMEFDKPLKSKRIMAIQLYGGQINNYYINNWCAVKLYMGDKLPELNIVPKHLK